jgi:syntaxin-binding protein 5
LDDKKILSTHKIIGNVHTICCDASIDYVLLGLFSGEIMAYDMDRGRLAPFKLPNFWKNYDSRARQSPVEALALHPRDIGTILIGYAEGAVIYSFKQNKPLKFFRYEVPRGAPGGDGKSTVARRPRLTHAIWHPTGTFVLTGHEDGSLVFWDAKDGRIVMARTLTETNVDKPSSRPMTGQEGGENEPLKNLVWCANQDPEDTVLLISGGTSSTAPATGLTLLELGRTPPYATSSWQVLSQYLGAPKRQKMLPIPPNTQVVNFCMIPRTSPYFAGAHDPLAIMALLASGEIITMSFPSGYPVSPTNQLHPSMSFVHPYITTINLSPVERSKWLSMIEKREKGPLFVTGGAEAKRPLKSYEHRNIVQAAHGDGLIRLWDAGHGDEVENDTVIQVDLDHALGHPEGAQVSVMSLSGASGEFSVGTQSGEVVIFSWGPNRNAGREAPDLSPAPPGQIQDISSRSDRHLQEGFVPNVLVDMQSGPVTAIKNSDVGFIAAGFQNGGLIVIDMRGPAIIFKGTIQDFAQQQSKSFGRKSHIAPAQGDFATYIEFSVMTLDDENYSSILLHVGTAKGLVATLKVLPQNGGRYGVQFAGVNQLDDRVIRIVPLQAEKGIPAYASQSAVGGLRTGAKTNGVLLAVTHSGCSIFKAPSSKGASKSWDHFVCQSAGVTWPQGRGAALVTVSDDGWARAFTLPGLKELATARITDFFDARRLNEAVITGTGDIFGFKSPAEASLINVWGRGIDLLV